MLGLIYKDIYCLKKHIRLFAVITIGVIVLAVSLILSMQYGNVAKFIRAEGITEEEFLSYFQAAIWATLLLPIASTAVIAECYKEDKKASFSKVLYSLPVKEAEIAGSRYLSGAIFLLLGLLGSMVASVCISFATDAFKLGELLSYSITFTAGLFLYLSFVMLLMYAMDGKKAALIECIPLVILMFVVEYFVVEKGGDMSEAEFANYMTGMIESVNNFMQNNSIWLLVAALFVMAISYLGSVQVLKKRGIS